MRSIIILAGLILAGALTAAAPAASGKLVLQPRSRQWSDPEGR